MAKATTCDNRVPPDDFQPKGRPDRIFDAHPRLKTKRRKPIKASTLCKKHFEALGYRVGLVERTLFPPDGRPPIRFDLFGFADLFAFHPKTGDCLMLQPTSVGHIADHKRKVLENPIAKEWVKAGHSIAVVGCARSKLRGGKPTIKVVMVTREEFE